VELTSIYSDGKYICLAKIPAVYAGLDVYFPRQRLGMEYLLNGVQRIKRFGLGIAVVGTLVVVLLSLIPLYALRHGLKVPQELPF